MERADQIMERLGFRKDAEDSVKAAFLKNLIKQAYGVEVQVPEVLQAPPAPKRLDEITAQEFLEVTGGGGEQLSFNIEQAFGEENRAG